MCGRYALDVTGEEIAATFAASLGSAAGWQASWNVAPTLSVPIVRASEGGRVVDRLRWGLVPSWSGDATIGSRMINARVETAASKPAFRESFDRRRCLVPAVAFYEWTGTGKRKRPMAIRPADGSILVFAGLWATTTLDDGTSLETFTILTTAAVEPIAEVHHRMPVMLPPERWGAWLDDRSRASGGEDADGLEAWLRCPYVPPLDVHEVSRRVNSPAHDEAALLEPVVSDPGDDEAEPGLFDGLSG